MRINWIELSGYLASALVFLTFYMKTMIPLRVVGILSNVAFMTYGLGGISTPSSSCTRSSCR
jgi:CRP/FNR family transcriptional regulator, cyclic AMP receptor protein